MEIGKDGVRRRGKEGEREEDEEERVEREIWSKH